MDWRWIAPRGRSGGLLLGVNKDSLEVLYYKEGSYFQRFSLKSIDSRFKWDILNVYGPVQLELKTDFLKELMEEILFQQNSIIVGGDFNLVRDMAEKSNGVINRNLVHIFNQFVNDTSLRELHRHGGSYTWTNKQENPIMAVLDRIFVSAHLDSQFPLATV